MKNSETPANIHAERLIDAVQDEELQGVQREMDRIWSEMDSLRRQMGQMRESRLSLESDFEGSREVLGSLLRVALRAKELAEQRRTSAVASTRADVIEKTEASPPSSDEDNSITPYQPDLEALNSPYNVKGEDRKTDAPTDYLPATFVRFHSLAIAVMTFAATLLTLSLAFDVQTVHPAVSGLLLAGGFSWFLTALSDIKEWRTEYLLRSQ